MPIKNKKGFIKEDIEIIEGLPYAAKSTKSNIPDVLRASRTGHIKQLRMLVLDKCLTYSDMLATLSDEEVEKLVSKNYCCFYIRTDDNDLCDMDTMYLIPRQLVAKSAIVISR